MQTFKEEREGVISHSKTCMQEPAKPEEPIQAKVCMHACMVSANAKSIRYDLKQAVRQTEKQDKIVNVCCPGRFLP